MASHLNSNHETSQAALRITADKILGRASVIVVPPSKDRALELARLILSEAPRFGAREMRDVEIVEALRAEQIGIATFRKALSAVRKELCKAPPAKPSGSATRKTNKRTASLPAKTEMPAAGSSMVENRDRTLL